MYAGNACRQVKSECLGDRCGERRLGLKQNEKKRTEVRGWYPGSRGLPRSLHSSLFTRLFTSLFTRLFLLDFLLFTECIDLISQQLCTRGYCTSHRGPKKISVAGIIVACVVYSVRRKSNPVRTGESRES